MTKHFNTKQTSQLLHKIFYLLPELKGMIARAAVMMSLIELLKLVPPYALKLALDFLVAADTDFSFVLYAIGGVLLASVVTTFVEDKYTEIICNNVFKTETAILKKSHKQLLSLDLRYHEDHPSGDNVQLLNKGSSRLADLSWFLYDQFLGAILQIVFTVIVLLFCDYRVGIVFSVFLPFIVLSINRSAQKLQPYRQRYHKKFREATWEMNQSLMNIRTVKDYRQEQREHGKYSTLLNHYRKLAMLRIRKEATDILLRDFLLTSARVTVLGFSVYLVYINSMSAGTFFLFATLSEKVIASMYRLGRLYSFLGDSFESVQQFSELFSEHATVNEKNNPVSKSELQGSITFKDVSFHYENKIPVLKNITTDIAAKSVVALVGRSGAGKSTFIKLLMRHYDVTDGNLLVDGIDIKDFSLDSLRSNVAVVSQDIEVFDSSVSENIAYGISAAQDEIEQVAKIAHAHDFIQSLELGYETRVGERGVKLSGGQKQRLGIARALLRKPGILIFDEATSSLDSESERLIQEAIFEIAHKQTIIIIAHRLSTIEQADKIIVLDEGRIIEEGTHDKLMSNKGLFSHMRNLQELGDLRT